VIDRKNPFFLVLTITLFGIAVAAGVWTLGQRNIQLRRDVMISGIQHIAADALQYRRRPSTMGGGGGSYAGYSIPPGLRENRSAVYQVAAGSSPDTLLILATGPQRIGTITGGVDAAGVLTILTLTGDLSY
jgi:hypothetical protein